MAATHNIHEEIESWLAAAVHDQLSPEGRAAFEEHLSTCASCRAIYKEELPMSNMIANTLDFARPSLDFEQRIVSNFRRKIPSHDGVGSLLIRLFRSRGIRVCGVAAILLTLLSLGSWLTTSPTLGNEELAVQAISSGDSLKDLRDQLGVKEFMASGAGREIMGLPADAVFEEGGKPRSNTPVEGLRQLPSFVGKASTENDSNPARAKKASPTEKATIERAVVTDSHVPTAETESALPVTVYSADVNTKAGSNAPEEAAEFVEEREPNPEPSSAPVADPNRKLVRKAEVELEVVGFDEAVQKIATLVADGKGYVASSSSEKQENGKLRGEIVVKIQPQSLDGFLTALRALGEVKNQTLGTDDVTKNYFDTDARLKNSRIMEQRLVEMLQKSTGKVSDLLQVEKELGRVREQIEQMQGELKYMDAQVAFATVTLTLAEKDMDAAAAFLLKRTGTMALFSAEVEKTFAEVKSALAGTKAQLASSSLDRDASGEVTAHLVVLLAPEEADTMIERIKGMGRVQSYKESSSRLAQGGSQASDTARDKIDKVELNLTISRTAQEPALQTTSLSILTSNVNEKVVRLKENAAKEGAEIRSSSFNSNSNGYEQASLTLRVPMKNYPALLKSFDQLGKVKDVNVRREDRGGASNEATAPADIVISVYNEPNIVSDEGGLFATIRRTLTQGALALMWSLRMIGVALAFLAPWIATLALVIWARKKIKRGRAARHKKSDATI